VAPVPVRTAPGERLPGLCPVHCTLDLRTMILTLRVDPGVIIARGNTRAYTQHPVTKKTVECYSRDRPNGDLKLVLNVASCTSVVFGIECKDAHASWVAVIDFNGKGDRWVQNATRF
jgi:hypothetical protein